MGISNSELLEELLLECYSQNIIDDVRKEAIHIMNVDERIGMLDAYEIAFKKFSKKN